MIIDIHAHIWLNRFEESKKQLIQAAERCGIDRIYVSALGGYFPDQDEIEKLNKGVVQLIKEDPKLFGGALYINPDNDDTAEVIKRGIEEDGMEMIKIWVSTYVDSPPVYEVAKTAIDYDIPILIHAMHKANGQVAHENTAENIAALAKKFPKLKIIMAHMGGNVYNGITAIQDCKNVNVDISMSIVRGDDLPYCYEKLSAERILFGTDMPGVGYYKKIGQVEDADLTQEEKEFIYYKNALRLLKRES